MKGVLVDWPPYTPKDQQGSVCDTAAVFNTAALKVREGSRDVETLTRQTGAGI